MLCQTFTLTHRHTNKHTHIHMHKRAHTDTQTHTHAHSHTSAHPQPRVGGIYSEESFAALLSAAITYFSLAKYRVNSGSGLENLSNAILKGDAVTVPVVGLGCLGFAMCLWKEASWVKVSQDSTPGASDPIRPLPSDWPRRGPRSAEAPGHSGPARLISHPSL